MTGEIDDLKERLTLEMNRANQAEKHAHLVVNISTGSFRNASFKILAGKCSCSSPLTKNVYS